MWDPVKIDGIYYNLPSSPTGKAMVVAPYGYKYTGDLTIPSAISYEGQQYDVDGLLYVLTAADISSLTLSEGFYQHKPVGAERGETEQCHTCLPPRLKIPRYRAASEATGS